MSRLWNRCRFVWYLWKVWIPKYRKINIDGGPNKVKLKEAIKNYKKLGISDPNDDYCKIILNEKNKRWLFIIFMIKYTYKLIFKYFAKNRFCSFNFC